MIQPKIVIFGKEHNVMQIEWNKKGLIEKIVYQVSQNVNKTVFRGNEVVTSSLTSLRKIQSPTEHPYHNYVLAPDLEKLLVKDEKTQKNNSRGNVSRSELSY